LQINSQTEEGDEEDKSRVNRKGGVGGEDRKANKMGSVGGSRKEKVTDS
jgi:hypothetical protein